MEIKKENLSRGANNLIEGLAELEHRQWCHLIKFLQQLPPDALRKKIYVDYKALANTKYKDLSEEDKEKDRVWARLVLKTEWSCALKEQRLRDKGGKNE